jgi:predicted 3-demethylubiquinone-9 3-methyltransferase (glyoxalase superfamily)
MQKIVPHLWYDKEAKEAAEFYVAVFGEDSRVTSVQTLHDTPSGDADMVAFDLWGYSFMSISAGPYFKLNPSISFMVNFDLSQDTDAAAKIDAMWAKLSEGGKVLMPLQEYPFSKRYGWVEDKYGVSWQLILTDPKGEERPRIIPSLLFVGGAYGKAGEAVDFYLSVFKDSKLGTRLLYGAGQEPNKEGTVMFSDFNLLGGWFTAMDGGGEHAFAFNEALSLVVKCDTQEEIDYYWGKLSAVPKADLPAPRPGAFYVYAIHCDDESMYIGQTQDLKERWKQHDAGTAAEHTMKHKPLGLIHYEQFNTREEAVKREQDLKTGFGRKWLKREWKAGRTRQAGQCGWLKDKYGVSWQIVPTAMDDMFKPGTDPEKMKRVTAAFLKMKKFDIADIEKAAEG